MDREKQIEEIAKVMCGGCPDDKGCTHCLCADWYRAESIYNAGYRKQSEWISVEDDLPKNQLARVLVFLKDDEFTKPIGFNKIDTDRYIDGKWVRWGKYVTHWMPLPEPPKMKGGEG